MANERYKKNPGKFGPKSVIGVYLRAMNMTQYRDLTYADSDTLSKTKTTPEEEPTETEYEQELLKKLEAGEITQEQYNTLTKTNIVNLSEFGGGTSIIDEDGFISGLKEMVPTEDKPADEPSTPQEQAPRYQIDVNY